MNSHRKAAIVTGSGTGVGAATALALARRGWDVLINYSRSEDQARASEAACRDAGARTLLMRGDVSQDADCRALAEAAAGAWGRLDALVNNAGISLFGAQAAWDALDAQAFQRILGVNTVGTFQMVRACLPHLKASRGCIVNVSSVAGSLGIGSSVPYIASKGAINAMTLHLARTLAPEVRVNAVAPGIAQWPDDYDAEIRRRLVARTLLKRPGTAAEIARAVRFLIEGTESTTGQVLTIDAGRTVTV